MALEDYKDLAASVAGILTIGQMFSGVFQCLTIRKKGSTVNIPGMPFIAGFILSILFLQHGLMLQDKAFGIVNFVGISLNIGYLTFYYFYSKTAEKAVFVRQFLKALGLIFVVLMYVRIEDPEKVQFRYGIFLTVLLFGLVSLPFLSIKEVIRTKSSERLPFPMILSGSLVCSSWLVYGIIINSQMMVVQNALILVISLAQLSLCLIYPSRPSQPVKESTKKE